MYERRNSKSTGEVKRSERERRYGEGWVHGRKEKERERAGGNVETKNDTARCVRQRCAATPFDVSVCVALEAGRGRWPRVRPPSSALGRARH